MVDPRQVDIDRQRPGGAHLLNGDGEAEEREKEETGPMAQRAAGKLLDGVSLGLAGELVAVPGNDEEVLYVLTDDLPVVPPEGSNSIQKECECVQPDVPELWVLIPIVLS